MTILSINLDTQFLYAIRENDLGSFNKLIGYRDLAVSREGNYPIRVAIENYRFKMALSILSHPNFDPSQYLNGILEAACSFYNLPILKSLILKYNIDITAYAFKSVRLAIFWAHVRQNHSNQIISFLLNEAKNRLNYEEIMIEAISHNFRILDYIEDKVERAYFLLCIKNKIG